MSIEKLTATPFVEVDNEPVSVYVDLPQEYTSTYATYDPFKAEFCGSFKVADKIMKDIHNSLTYQVYIEPYFKIKEVIFNDPATIVYWEDGTKTVVKCGKDDTYNKETGLALCFMKKALNNKGNYNNLFRKYIKEK